MADQNYEIRLKVTTDDSSLDRLEKRLRDIEGRGIPFYPGRGSNIGGGNKYKWIPPSHLPAHERLSNFFGNRRFVSNANYLENVNEAYRRLAITRHSFIPNLATWSGILRNISNVSGVLMQLGRVAGGVVPVIGQLGSGLKTFLAFRGARDIIGGAAFFGANRILQGESLGTAASDLMQMRMAEKGLGGLYKPALDAATNLASTFGFSRVGMLNAINMFSGLNIGSRKLSFAEAVNLATIAGKISHVGNVPFEKVNVNLQQLLGQQTPSVRDIREMVGQAPFLGKLAMQMMERSGISGNYFDWLKDKSNITAVLEKFDQLIETSPVLKARGETALAKQDFWIRIASDLAPYWDQLAKANRRMYEWLGDKIVGWVSKINPEEIGRKFDSILSDLNTFASALGGIASVISTVSRTVSDAWSILFPYSGAAQVGGKKYVVGRTYSPQYEPVYDAAGNIAGYSLGKGGLLHGKRLSSFEIIDAVNMARRGAANAFSLDSLGYAAAAAKAGIPSDSISLTYSRFAPVFKANKMKYLSEISSRQRKIGVVFDSLGKPSDWTIPEYFNYGLNPAAIREWYTQVNPYSDVMTGGTNGAATNELGGISKGARSLVINFNREIVNMPVNIDKVNDGADLANQISSQLYDVIVRGLNISLNNATGAI